MPQPHTSPAVSLIGMILIFTGACERIPRSLIALLGRFSIAAVFWKSAQTKVDGFAIDLIDGTFQLGWPRLSDSVVALFREEYQLPLLSPESAAYMAAFAEHLFPALLLLGLGTRFAALALLGITVVIQFFVYPDAYTRMVFGLPSCSTSSLPDRGASPSITG